MEQNPGPTMSSEDPIQRDSQEPSAEVQVSTAGADQSVLPALGEELAPPTALWTPRGIGWASGLLGFPGGLILAALNWRRMARPRKAVVHLVAAVVGAWALFFVNVPAGVPVGFAVGYYLYRTQRIDQSRFVSPGRLTERNGLLGALLAIGGSIALIGSGAVLAAATGVGGYANRGLVAFGTGAANDACVPAGQKTAFDPSDPIFLAAVMRETVRPGAHVVYEFAGPGAAAGPIAVTVEPPFDCLVSKGSIGPLAPGAYVVRYRYDAPPGSPDLATGSFTVVDRPGASAASSPRPVALASRGATPSTVPTASANSWHVTATIPVGVKPFNIAAGAGALWVANSDGGTVDRIDPATARIVKTVPLQFKRSAVADTANPFGIAVDRGRVWVTSAAFDRAGNAVAGVVNVIDAETNSEIEQVSVGKLPLDIAAGFGSLWVANEEDGTVSRVDQATLRVSATIAVGAGPGSIAVAAGAVWVGDAVDGTLTQIDPVANSVVATMHVAKSLLNVAATEHALWVTGTTASPDAASPAPGDESWLFKIDPTTMQVVARAATGGIPAGLALGNGQVWVAEGGTTIVREIDQETATVLAEVHLDTNSYGIVLFGGSVWVVQPAAADQKFDASVPGTVTRLDP